MAYAAASDMQLRFDERTLAELVSDTDVAIDTADLATDTKLAAALDDASGVIDAALLTGGRYSAASLSGLTGNSLALLKRLCCVLAMTFLRQRRVGGFPSDVQQIEADQRW
ncbi:MAG: phage protein Gp36 family protein, partial [Candidatus Nanopelagicales bacterium]